MGRWERMLGALWMTALVGAVATGAQADTPPAGETERLLKSHATERYSVPVPGFSIRAGGGMTVINASLATVRRSVTDYGKYADFMPRFQKSRVVGKSGPYTDVYLQVSILHGAANIWAVTRFGAAVPEGAGERIEGKMNGQGNVDDLRATWHLLAIDEGHTLAKLELLLVPKLPLPGSVITPELEYASDQAVTAMRVRLEGPTPVPNTEPRSDNTEH